MSRRNRPRHTVTVTIAGEKHVLRSDAAPEYTLAVAEHVDRTVQALGDAQPLQPHRTAILAALFITDEFFRARAELRQLREELEGGTARLAERLEHAVGEGRQPQSAAPGVGNPDEVQSSEPAPPAPGSPPAEHPDLE
jgi:cell division protein ZapA